MTKPSAKPTVRATMTVREAAAILDVSTQHVYQLIGQGRLEATSAVFGPRLPYVDAVEKRKALPTRRRPRLTNGGL